MYRIQSLILSLLQLPEISVLSNPYVVGDLEILVHGEWHDAHSCELTDCTMSY